jgi:cell fate regulator YaaT (PSP1 superfamily)
MACGSCGSGGGCGTGCGGNGGCAVKGKSACGSKTGRAGTKACPAMHVYDWLSEIGIAGQPVVFDLVEVSFKGGRKDFFRNTLGLDVQTGDHVIVAADRGIDFGSVSMSGELVRLRVKSKGLDEGTDFPNVIRVATLEDIERRERIREEESETFLVGRRAIDRMNLPMKLVDVEWQFDRSKVTFYFTAEHRVDFRQLVRELAGRFRTRVELRQIGARDEAARLGGIGSCGRELCCSTWLQEFKPVSTQAAKVQNLPLNPVRLSGQCGRLKCCLNYELEQYMSALREFPPVDTPITTAYGRGVVQKLDIFHQVVWIQYQDGTWEEKTLETVREILGVKDLEQEDVKFAPPAPRGKRRNKPRGGKDRSKPDAGRRPGRDGMQH